ncbi:hypothetical protein EJ06DRAFT_584491 [Trichodelitschia bisporula]|uniref:Large ribosomal subunit protein mL54 n=1 Tax=Trichodelitschia bisporula TaxID=703511 RepID=A0A6G1HNU0_9PEZI|nr:hypothetical protein EJ06DRAFT_584491 [Trichodelitschia bisporula]
MICQRCLFRAARTSRRDVLRALPFSTSVPRTGPPDDKPAAPSHSATEPFTTPYAISPVARGMKPSESKAKPAVVSSVPAGTPLKGLNFMKGQTDPVAMEDSEYPPWLWDILTVGKKGEESAVDAADLYSKSKTKRAKALKLARKQGLLGDEVADTKVPIYEQSIDLPTGDGTLEATIEAEQARKELTKAMRTKRRSEIKEKNFLKTMA